MTVIEANQVLNQRLHFGDASQIEALRFLRALAAGRARVMSCRHCDGDGLNLAGQLCRWCAAGLPADVTAALGIAADPQTPRAQTANPPRARGPSRSKRSTPHA